jgi:hypothetical protein
VGLGLGISEEDLEIVDKFTARLQSLTQFASDRNCMLYVDAEQSFI